MTIRRARVAIDVEGLPEMPISGLRISNVVATAKVGMKAFNTAGMELHSVQIDVESGPAFLVRDSSELELDNVSTRLPHADAPVVSLNRTAGAIVRSSRALPGTGTFLSTGPGELKSIFLEGNVLSGAHQPTGEAKADYWKSAEPPTETEPAAKGAR
jgi:hypothetical protein